MIGIAEMFAEYSEPDEFHVAAQLELFAWRYQEASREVDRRRYHARKPYVLSWQRAHRAQKQREGVLCSRCSSVRVDGKSSCQRHLDWDRERWQRRQSKRAA